MLTTYLNRFQVNFTKLYQLPVSSKFVVAVSGGADSLALLLLMHKFTEQTNHKLIVVTIDHNLRKESHDEALYVGSICQKYNIEHHILTWQHTQTVKNIQQQARLARYELLTNFCQLHDILYILTAHHKDDRIENFFIRLSRGSGLHGLSEHNIHYYNNIQIIRPLFNFSKDECYQILKLLNISHIEDPSNNNKKFLRNELRNNINDFFDLKTIKPATFKNRVVSTIENINIGAKSLENNFIKCLVDSSIIYPSGHAEINLLNYYKYNAYEQHQLLAHLLTVISNKSYKPRYDSLILLYDNILNTLRGKQTLHGCIITWQKSTVHIWKEISVRSTAQIITQQDIYWDNRFVVKNIISNTTDLYIDYINNDDYRLITQKLQSKYSSFVGNKVISLPKQIIFTLPAIKSIEKLLAIPHINYYSCENKALELKNLTIQFKPYFVSRLTHYVF